MDLACTLYSGVSVGSQAFPDFLKDFFQVDLACTAGSPLGAKLASAFETCLGGEQALKPEEVKLFMRMIVFMKI